MALIMYLNRAPRYQNSETNEYETIPREDLVLTEEYFNWDRAKYEAKHGNGRHYASTLKEWCGLSADNLNNDYINYYSDFYTRKKWWSEIAGEVEGYSIFEQVARVVKANQIVEWFVKNVMNGKLNTEYYEVTKNQLYDLFDACIKVKNNCTLLKERQYTYELDEYDVNEEVAKQYLPLMKNKGFFFGTDKYDNMYMHQIDEMIDILRYIFETTDFERQVIYFNAIW